MKILVFEWMVGGGMAGEAAPPADDPFLKQGASMFGAILDDCLKLRMEVLSPLDVRLNGAIGNFVNLQRDGNFHATPVNLYQELEPVLQALAQEADHVVLIAPESDGILARCLQWLDAFQSKLVCGPQSLIEVCVDKNATQQLLKSKGIPVPSGTPLLPDVLAGRGVGAIPTVITTIKGLAWPLVVKPATGAGGDGVLLCHNREQLEAAATGAENADEALRVERFIAGRAASVSIVRNEHETRLLPGTEQRFSNCWSNGKASGILQQNSALPVGHFVESIFPLEADLERRATALAGAVAQALPAWRGYLGVDMILADDGHDVVVELNPRLTASYETIRAETGFNLMEFLLKDSKSNDDQT